jgi:hypothetical protein
MRKVMTGAIMALAAFPGVAQAAEAPCLTPAEFTALATYGLPSVIKGVTDRCSASLPSGSWLPRNGAPLASHYAAAKPAAWPGAKAAFMKLGATGKDSAEMFRKLPDKSLQPMVDGLIEGLIGQEIPLEKCTMVDRVVRLISPLPPENTAELIALLAGLGSKSGGDKVDKLRLCPA